MINDKDKRFVNLMLESINRLILCREKYDVDQAANDFMIFDVVLMEFENLTNYALKLSTELVESHPEIHITELRAIRNRIAHDYLSVSIEILYDSINNDFPLLKETLINLLK